MILLRVYEFARGWARSDPPSRSNRVNEPPRKVQLHGTNLAVRIPLKTNGMFEDTFSLQFSKNI